MSIRALKRNANELQQVCVRYNADKICQNKCKRNRSEVRLCESEKWLDPAKCTKVWSGIGRVAIICE